MKKLLVLAIALMVICAPAFAQNLVVNGDFSTDGDETGWTQWQAPRGEGIWTVEGGQGVLQANGTSFGWYQAITVEAGKTYQIDANWMGNGNLNWAEVLFFNDDGRDIYVQCDSPLDSSVIAKVDGWGMNGGPQFGVPNMPSITGFYYPAGLKTNQITATGDTMYVVLKTGAVNNAITYFDNVTVQAVPEPASMLALVAGLGGLIIRRKR